MPNLEGKRLRDARPGSPAATRNAAFDRMSHAESVAAYHRSRGDEGAAEVFDRQAEREWARARPDEEGDE
jgi:hypothetical protein